MPTQTMYKYFLSQYRTLNVVQTQFRSVPRTIWGVTAYGHIQTIWQLFGNNTDEVKIFLIETARMEQVGLNVTRRRPLLFIADITISEITSTGDIYVCLSWVIY